MQTLETYIEQKNIEENKFDFIDKDFIDYFNLEWQLNHCQIYEELIYESKVVYDGQIEQAEIIDDEFQKNRNNDTIIISYSKFDNIPNTFFDKIYIHTNLTKNDEYGVYKQSDAKYTDYNEIRWDIENKRFKFVEISIYINKNTKTVKDIILHELKHYWDDYNGFKNCKTILDIAASNSKYSRFLKVYNDDDFTANVKQINNMFSKIEQNAYISQLVGQLGDILKHAKYHSIDEAVKKLLKSKEYARYKKLKEFVISILNNKDLQNKYTETYRNITKSLLEDNKIIDKLDYKFNKFWTTLQKAIYQYIEKEHLVRNSVLNKDVKNFIK